MGQLGEGGLGAGTVKKDAGMKVEGKKDIKARQYGLRTFCILLLAIHHRTKMLWTP